MISTLSRVSDCHLVYEESSNCQTSDDQRNIRQGYDLAE